MKTILTALTLVCAGLILVGIFPLQSFAAIDPNTIVGEWLFDEGNGAVTEDSSNSGNDGKLTGDPKWVEGKFGKAVEFDGVDDSMEAGSTGLPTGANDRTIAFWLKSPNVAVGNKFLVGWGNAAAQQMSCLIMGLMNEPRRKFAFWGWNNDFEASTVLENDTWYHLAFTLEGGTSAKLYLNGNVDKEGSLGAGLDTSAGTTFYVANFKMIMTAFGGTFDEVVVFNTALTQGDIKSLMQGLSQGTSAVSPSGKLAATWGRIKNHK